MYPKIKVIEPNAIDPNIIAIEKNKIVDLQTSFLNHRTDPDSNLQHKGYYIGEAEKLKKLGITPMIVEDNTGALVLIQVKS